LALVLLASQDKTQVGQIAPDFRQQTPKGDTIRLSDFRGKYLLLDFWLVGAVLDGGNPNLVKAYDQYKDKGFEILSVSMDNPGQRDAWLEAIEADGLTLGTSFRSQGHEKRGGCPVWHNHDTS